MNHGKFSINKNDLLDYLGLTKDSHVQVKDDGDYIELYVITDGDNGLVTKKTSNDVNLRRTLIPLYKRTVGEGLNYYVYNDLNMTMQLNNVSDEQAIEKVKEMDLDGEVQLVKTKLLYPQNTK